MRRGDVYLIRKPGSRDPKKRRLFVVVSRQPLVDSRLSTVICAPVYSSFHGLATQVRLSAADGVKQECCIHCDELVSLQKDLLTDYVTSLRTNRFAELARALRIALDIDDSPP